MDDRISTPDIEWFRDGEQIIALVIRTTFLPDRTTFITPDSFYQQAGCVVYPAGGHIAAHDHKPIERHLVGTSETLIVRRGRCIAHLFRINRQPLAEVTLEQGDIIVLVSGGHGFTMLEDTIFLEIKQGPYTGLVEKERFE